MKKIVFTALGAAVLLSASYYGYRQVSNSSEDDIFLANVEALSEEELSKEDQLRQRECYAEGGNWNMASVCAEGGIEVINCERNGEISVLGVVVKGGYKKNKNYLVKWERYECQDSPKNCCTKQGVFVDAEDI